MQLETQQSYVIAGSGPSAELPTVRFAAKELARYVRAALGAPCRARVARDVETGSQLILRPSGAGKPTGWEVQHPAHPDEHVIRVADDQVTFSAGSGFGLLYAVYAFLRDKLGIRFLTPLPNGEKVPSCSALTLDECVLHNAPAFDLRGMSPTENSTWYSEEEVTRHIDWMAKNGMNWFCMYANFGWDRLKKRIVRETRLRGMKLLLQVHSFEEWLPRSLYSQSPEFFPLIDGRRRGDYKVQRCCASPAAVRAYVENGLRWFREQPALDYLCIQHNDGLGWCECDVCRNLSFDQCFARFFAPLAKAIKKRAPKLRLVHYIYTARWDARGAADGIYDDADLIFDTFARCKWHSLNEGALCSREHGRWKANNFLRENLKAWRRKAGGGVFVLENTALHGMMSSPAPNITTLARDLRHYSRSGVRGCLLQGYLHSWVSYAPTLHVLSQCMWDVKLDAAAAVSAFFRDQYGEGAGEQVSRMWLGLERKLASEKTCYMVTWGKLSPRDYDRILGTFRRAKKQVSSNEERNRLADFERVWRYCQLWADGSRLDFKVMHPLQDPFALVTRDMRPFPSISPSPGKRELAKGPTPGEVSRALSLYTRLWDYIEASDYGTIDSYYVRWLLAIRCWLVLRHYVLTAEQAAKYEADGRRVVPPNRSGIMRPQQYIEDVLRRKDGRYPTLRSMLAAMDRGLDYEKRLIASLP